MLRSGIRLGRSARFISTGKNAVVEEKCALQKIQAQEQANSCKNRQEQTDSMTQFSVNPEEATEEQGDSCRNHQEQADSSQKVHFSSQEQAGSCENHQEQADSSQKVRFFGESAQEQADSCKNRQGQTGSPQKMKSKVRLKEISLNPGISEKPIASPVVARFKRMSISREAQELLEILESAGRNEEQRRDKLSEYYGRLSTDIVVEILNHVSDPDAAVYFFNWCNGRLGYVHTSFTFNRLLELLVRKGQTKRAHEMLVAEKDFPYHPNSFAYATIVQGYCEQLGDTKQALALLAHMKKNNVNANSKIYNIIITHLCKLGKEREALEILHTMTSSSCTPDVYTYNILINALCKVGRLKDAEGVAEMMQTKGCQLDIVTYNTLIHGLCKKGGGKDKAERALELFSEMVDKGYTPTAVTYTVVIDALLRAQMDSEAQEILEHMSESGCSFDLVTYNVLINRFVKAGFVDKAEELFREMPSRGCVPDVVTYNTLIDGLCKKRKVDEANEMFKEMVEKGLSPNGRTYTMVADVCLKSGKMKEAHKYLVEMRERNLADAISYIALISTISKMGMGTLAFELLKEMISKGFKPNLVTFDTVFRALSDDDEAKMVTAGLRQQYCGNSNNKSSNKDTKPEQ